MVRDKRQGGKYTQGRFDFRRCFSQATLLPAFCDERLLLIRRQSPADFPRLFKWQNG
jgi:hypothetical protein